MVVPSCMLSFSFNANIIIEIHASFNANIVIEIHACNGSFSGNATKWLIWQSKATKKATIAT